MGGMLSLRDLEHKFFGRLLDVSLTRPDVAGFLMKKIFRHDPQYYWYDPDLKKDFLKEVDQVGNRALIDRFLYLKPQGEEVDSYEFSEINALLMWWQNDFVSNKGRDRISALFPSKQLVIVPGRHGQTATSREHINTEIETFLTEQA